MADVLQPEQIASYRDNGYLVLEAHIPDDIVAHRVTGRVADVWLHELTRSWLTRG